VSLKPDERGYGTVVKVLHWTTMLLALAAQFAVGYSMDRGEHLLEWAVDRWLDGEEEALLPVHVALGLLILALLLAHVGLVRKHQLVDRDGLRRRML
jgi:cytochrome b561